MEAPCTRRQLEIAQLLADGLQQPEIAAQMGIALNTVRRLTFEARERTGTHTAAGLIAHLMRRGGIR